MSKTAEQVQAMKDELQSWFDSNGFTRGNDYGWFEVADLFEGKELTFRHPHYLALGYDGGFSRAMCGHEWQGRKGHWLEFSAIVTKHGCYMENLDVYIVIYDKTLRG